MIPAYNFFIRPANPGDVDLLRELSVQTFTETYHAYNTAEDMLLYISKNFSSEVLCSELEDAGNYFFIAMLEDRAVGYIKLRTAEEPAALKGRKHIELERIYALKEFQGTGLGKLLMQQCIDTATSNGFEVVWLGVWKQNEKAFAFYKKCGFTIFGEHIFTLGTDEQSDWLMKKELVV